MNKEYFSQSESSTFQAKPSKPRKQTNHLYQSRKNPFCLNYPSLHVHYNSFGTISVKNSLDTDAVGIYQGHEEEEHFSWHKYRSRVYIDLQMKKSAAQISKEKIHLWQRKNTIFKLSFPKLAGSIP